MAGSLELWLGRAAVAHGFVDRTRLEAVRQAQAAERPAPPVGVLLVEGGWLTHAQVADLLVEQADGFEGADPHTEGKVQAWRFAAAALARGAATPEQVNRALREQARREEKDGTWVPLGKLLLEHGTLTETQAADLLRAGGGDGPGLGPVTVTARPADDAAATPRVPPPVTVTETPAGMAVSGAEPHGAPGAAGPVGRPAGRLFGRYELLAELGRGGMGIVYRAYDTQLRREVALKTLMLGDAQNPYMVERLLREARTAGTLAHPGIVQIHDVGAVDGIPYFAMAYVQGRTLHEVLRTGDLPGLRARAEVVCEAAEAVAHAHERQIVHRDLKPGNLLLDPEGHVHVMDFGIAKNLGEGTRLTATGQMLGTPQFMPPEQINGDLARIGPASDVYALGAVLYESLAGRPPYDGLTMAEIIAKSLARDPEPLRSFDRRIPADLETICLKALQREPERRYPTARELAADLRRWLSGEAIDARPDTWLGKGARWVKRRRGMAALAGLGAVAACVSVGLGLHTLAVERERAALAQQVLAGLRETSAAYLESTLLARRAGAPMAAAREKFLVPLERAVRRASLHLPRLAEPHYHLGRMYRALMRFDAALAAQDEALGKEPGYAPSLYERAILRTRRYGDRLAELREEWLRAEGQRLRAAGLLEAGSLASSGARERPPDAELAGADAEARGLARGIGADLERLERAAPASGELEPALLDCARGLHAAQTATGATGRARARRLLEHAVDAAPTLEEAHEGLVLLAAAEGDLQRALDAYARGLAADRGYVPHLVGRAALRLMQGTLGMNRGQDPGEFFTPALADLDRALELDPDSAPAHLARAALSMNAAVARSGRGQEPAELYRKAEADYAEALRLDPGSVRAWLCRGSLRKSWGDDLAARGEDPDELLARADADFAQAIERSPQTAEVWLARAGAAVSLGLHQAARGQDPGPAHERAADQYGKALELDPSQVLAWKGRGIVRAHHGLHVSQHGGDPSDLFTRAAADLTQALALDATAADTWLRRAELRSNWAGFKKHRGEDPTELYRQALADFDRAVACNPRSGHVWASRGGVTQNLALYRTSRGEPAVELFTAAEADYGKALELNPAAAEAWLGRGGVRANWGTVELARGADPTGRFTQAQADFTKALELNARSFEAWIGRGTMCMNWGGFRQGQRQDPGDLFARAEADCSRALDLNATAADAWMYRGTVRLAWGTGKKARGEDAEPLLRGALDDLGRSVQLNPAGAEARGKRGMAHCYLGHWTEAISDFEAAMQIDPRIEASFRAQLEAVRARLKPPK